MRGALIRQRLPAEWETRRLDEVCEGVFDCPRRPSSQWTAPLWSGLRTSVRESSGWKGSVAFLTTPTAIESSALNRGTVIFSTVESGPISGLPLKFRQELAIASVSGWC